MTDASTTGAVERLAGDLQTAYSLVAEWPENKPDGFMNLLALRNMVPEAATTLRALVAERDAAIQRAEAAEQERDAARDESLRELMAMEVAALAWEAGRDAAAECAMRRYLNDSVSGHAAEEVGNVKFLIERLTPPAELSAALTARLDAEWNAAIEAAEAAYAQGFAAIRALRRAAPTEGEA